MVLLHLKVWLNFLKYILFNLHSMSLKYLSLLFCFNLINGFHILYFETKFCYVIQTDLELVVFLSQPPKCLDNKLWAYTTVASFFIVFKPVSCLKNFVTGYKYRRLIQQFILKSLWVASMVKVVSCAKIWSCEYVNWLNITTQYNTCIGASYFIRQNYAICICLKNWLLNIAASSHLFLHADLV